MKYLLLLLFIPGMALSQKIDSLAGTGFILTDNDVIFSRVYTSDLAKDALIAKLKTFLPTVKGFQLTDNTNQAADQFSGKLSDYVVNFRKFGGSAMGTSMLLHQPLTANVIIQVKDNKYKVTVRDIIFKDIKISLNDTGTDIEIADALTKSKRSAFRTNDNANQIATYTHKDFSASFDIATAKTDDF